MAESETSSTVPETGSGTSGSGLHIDDVYLEGETPEGTAVVGHLSVVVDAGGITVVGPGPDARRTVSWERMSSIELGPPATLPDGQSVSSLQFSLDGRPLRLLVPTGVAGVLGAASSVVAAPSGAPAAAASAAGRGGGRPASRRQQGGGRRGVGRVRRRRRHGGGPGGAVPDRRRGAPRGVDR